MNKTGQEQTIIDDLRWHYLKYSDPHAPPKEVYETLSALRRAHNYFAGSTDRLNKSKYEKTAKFYKHSSCLTILDAEKCAKQRKK